jgi:hypothetical protein
MARRERGRTVELKGGAMQALMTIVWVSALAGGSLIFAGFLVVGFFVFAFSWYTRRGSGINQHPYGDIDHNSGPEAPSELAHDTTSDVMNWDHGVAGNEGRRHPPSTPS